MWCDGWQRHKLRHHPAKFSDHRHCDSGHIISVLVCHVISEEQIIKGSCDVSYNPGKFDTVLVEI